MASAQEAIDHISDYLAKRMPLESFEDWSASYMRDVYRTGDARAQALGQLVRSILNAFEDDSAEDAMRGELANAIRPFVKPVTSMVSFVIVGHYKQDETERTPGISLVHVIPRKPAKPEVSWGTSNSPTWRLVPAKALLS